MGKAKWLTWFAWILNLIISAVYCVGAIWTFRLLLKEPSGKSWAARDGLLACCIMGTFVVASWLVTSFLVLLSHGWGKSPLGYGFMLGSALHTGIFQLLAALMLNASRSWAASLKSSTFSTMDYQVYVGTFFLSYVLCGTYLVMFCILLFARTYLAGDDSEEKPLRTNMHQHSTREVTDSATSQKKSRSARAKISAFCTTVSEGEAAPPALPMSHEPIARTSLQYGASPQSWTKSSPAAPSKYGAFNV